MRRLFCLSAILFFYGCPLFGQGLFPEDGTAQVTKWFYNPAQLDVIDTKEFLKTLQSLGITPIEVKNVGSYVQDTLFFDSSGNRLLLAPISDVAMRQTGGWTNSIWDYDHDLLGNFNYPIPHVKTKQLKIFMAEGGAVISGKDKMGKPYVLITMQARKVVENELRYAYIKKNKLWPTENEILDKGLKELGEIERYALTRAPAPSDSEILELLSEDLELPTSNIYFINSKQFLHIDVVMLPLPGKKILLNSVDESETQIQKLGLPKSTTATVISNLEKDKKSLNEIAQDLAQLGFEVIRVGGIWRLPDGRNINLFNGFQGLSNLGKQFLITNSGYEFKSVESYFSSELNRAGYLGDIFYLGKYHPYAGIDCMGAIAP